MSPVCSGTSRRRSASSSRPSAAIRCSAPARGAGYLGSDGGQELVRRAVEKVTRGHTLLVFPEGTREPEGKLLLFKSGFASIARRAHAPVQLLRITTDSDMLTKGRPILRLPRVPTHVTITVG